MPLALTDAQLKQVTAAAVADRRRQRAIISCAASLSVLGDSEAAERQCGDFGRCVSCSPSAVLP